MVNTVFTNYIDQFNLTKQLKFPILTNKTTSEYTLPIFLNNSKIDDSLLTAPQTLKDYIAQYKNEKEIFDLKERHDIDELDLETPYKISLITISYGNICIYNSHNISYNNYDNNIHSV